MAQVPSNLIPTTVTQLPVDPTPSDQGFLMYVRDGVNYKVQASDLLSVSGVPITRQVVAGTGLTGGGQLTADVTLSIAPNAVGAAQLAPTGVAAGTYGDSLTVPVITLDVTGRVMSVVSVPIASLSNYVPVTRQVIAGAGLTGGGQLTGNVTLSASLSDTTPQTVENTGASGVATDISRSDHKHPAIDLASDAQVDGLLGLDHGGTAKSLVPNAGGMIWSGADGLYVGPPGSAGQVVVSGGTNAPSWGSALVISDQAANLVYAGPGSGPLGPTSFRHLVNADLPDSGVVAATYGSATQVAQVAVDAKGVVTSATNVTVTPAFADITATPTTLTGYGITDSQPLDADLSAIAALAGTSGLLKKTAADTWTLDTTAYGLGDVVGPASAVDSNVALFDGITGNLIKDGGTLGSAAFAATTAFDPAGAAAAVTPTSLGLVIGTNVQAYDADLTTWAGITPGTGVATALGNTAGAANGVATYNQLGTAAFTASTDYAAAVHATRHYPGGADPVNAHSYHGVVSRTTIAPLPVNLTTTTFTLSTGTTPMTYFNNSTQIVVATDRSTVLSGAAGLYFIYFDITGTLVNSTTFPGLAATSGNVIIATVTWNGTNFGAVNDERHGFDRDTAWHTWAHNTVGSRYGAGLSFSYSGTTNLNTTFSISTGNIYDEDIDFTIPTSTVCRLWRQTSAIAYSLVAQSSTLPYLYSAGIQAVNATTFALVTTTNSNRYFNFFVYGTTDVDSPIHVFVETTATTWGYTSVANARLAPIPSLAQVQLSPEYKILYRLVVNGAGLIQTPVAADDYRRASVLASSTASSVSYTPTAPDATTNVQAALDLRVFETSATGSAYLPSGTTAQRDGSPLVGYTRFNTTLNSPEVWDGAAWTQVSNANTYTLLTNLESLGGVIAVPPGVLFVELGGTISTPPCIFTSITGIPENGFVNVKVSVAGVYLQSGALLVIPSWMGAAIYADLNSWITVRARSGGVVEVVSYSSWTALAASPPPIGSSTPNTGSFTSLTDSGNLTFTGTGNRITGDFSNATADSRVMFQSSVVDGNTQVRSIPNGTSTTASMQVGNTNDPANQSVASLHVTSTEASIFSTTNGTGTFLPLTLYTYNTEKLRIAANTTGTYTFGGTAPRITGDFSNATVANRIAFQSSTVNGFTSLVAIPNGTSTVADLELYSGTTANESMAQLAVIGGVDVRFSSNRIGSGTYLPMSFYTGGATERMRIDTSGNVTLSSATGGLGYGTGAGGTVTQITSKATAVTLNKPCGQITMHNAALAAGASVTFSVSDSLVTSSDLILLSSPAFGLSYRIENASVGTGIFYIRVTNITAGSLSEVLAINFAIIKGATS